MQAPPRVAVKPAATRANAWEDVSDLSASFGVKLDDWQDAVLEAAMGERADGTWAADVIGLSVPRQNGKSQLLVARALAGALLFGEEKIIISAHAQDTAREAFGKLLDMRDSSPALASRITKVMTALNREFVRFSSGATIQFKARTVSGSRGFSCDCLLLDEAQILGMPAWVSIRSTMSARPNPQAWLLGTPPTPEDNGEVFGSVRASALTGRTRRTAYLEWSADPSDDPSLEETRAKANPAWLTRINHEVVQGEYETYPPDRFALDRLGIWLGDLNGSIFPQWPLLAKGAPSAISVNALGVATDRDQTWLSLGAVIDAERPHLAIVDRRRATDRKAFAENVARIQRERGCEVLIRGKNFIIPDLEEAGVALRLVDSFERAQAHADLATAIENAEIEHGDYPELNAAVGIARWRATDTGRSFDARQGDVSTLEAVALALHGAESSLDYDPLESVL